MLWKALEERDAAIRKADAAAALAHALQRQVQPCPLHLPWQQSLPVLLRGKNSTSLFITLKSVCHNLG